MGETSDTRKTVSSTTLGGGGGDEMAYDIHMVYQVSRLTLLTQYLNYL